MQLISPYFFFHRLCFSNKISLDKKNFSSQVHPVKADLAAMMAPVAKMRVVTSLVTASPALLAASANLNWECDCASRIHVRMTAFV